LIHNNNKSEINPNIMSGLTFQWPANGAVRDVKELEYISALLQAGSTIRPDGTITAGCMVTFLRSRHGLVVDKEYFERNVIGSLAGDPRPSEISGKQLDIPQLASLLLLPYLHRVQKEGNEQEKQDLFGSVLSIILTDTGLKDSPEQDKKIPLTVENLGIMFAAYGENKCCPVALQAMVDKGGGAFLDQETFIRALTSDLDMYNLKWESSYTTYFNDILEVYGSSIGELYLPPDKRFRPEGDLDLVENKDEESHKASSATAITADLDHMKMINNLSSIDSAADTFKTNSFFTFVMISMIVMFVAYFAGNDLINDMIPCDDFSSEFGCKVAKAIANWLFIFVQTGLMGAFYVYFASTGNSNYLKSRCPFLITSILIGILFVAAFHFLPFFDKFPIKAFFSRTDDETVAWTPYLVLILGSILLLFQILMLLQTLFPETPWLQTVLREPEKEVRNKRAASFKTRGLFDNAISLHSASSSNGNSVGGTSKSFTTNSSSFMKMESRNRALLNYESKLNDTETLGGFWWFWNRFFASKICSQHGLWMSSRLLAGNAAQLIVFFGFLFLWVWTIQYVLYDYDDSNSTTSSSTYTVTIDGGPRSMYYNASGSFLFSQEVDDTFLSVNELQFGYAFDQGLETYYESYKDRLLRGFLVAMRSSKDVTSFFGLDSAENLLESVGGAVYNATGIDLDVAAEYVTLYRSFQGGFVSFVFSEAKKRVTSRELLIPLIYGGICGTLAILSVVLFYIPSAASQTLKLRSGVDMRPLTDARFASLRKGSFAETTLFGGALWGVAFTGGVVALLNGGILFLVVWSETSEYLLGVLANLIGLTVSLGIKVIILSIAGEYCFAGYYRKKPALCNIITIVLECWNVAVSVGFIISRSVKLLLTTCVYLGRIDTMLLSKDANKLFSLEIDAYPSAFTTDLLLHEAHRHPYIERLGVLYLLKAYSGESFATRDGSCWRLLFTLALMPWLRRYRAKDIMLLSHAEERNLTDLEVTSKTSIAEEKVAETSKQNDEHRAK
jgi:hypothetical protein